MALFRECTPQCAQKELDTADIVRDAWLRKLTRRLSQPGFPVLDCYYFARHSGTIVYVSGRTRASAGPGSL